MKKLLEIIVLGLLLSGNVSAEDPPYFENSLNKNIIIHGWKIISQGNGGLVATEIYKLKKDNWILICTVQTAVKIETKCKLP